jgi:hypothetical protein
LAILVAIAKQEAWATLEAMKPQQDVVLKLLVEEGFTML